MTPDEIQKDREAGTPGHDWLIHKAGREWYRPNAMGYTSDPSQAGRYSYESALRHSYPNGLSGPRDGITIKHESEIDIQPPADPTNPFAHRGTIGTTVKDHIATLTAENAALKERVAKLEAALNQSRLAFAGYVSVQSAVDLIDALQENPNE